MLVEEGPDLRHGDRGDHVGETEHLAPEGVTREHRLCEALVHEVGRFVEVHEHLFQDDLALRVDLSGTECRLPHDVGENVEAELEILAEEAHVKGRVLLRRVRVHVAAHRVDHLGDVASASRWCPFKQQVLEEVRDSRLLVGLVPTPGPDPEPDRDGLHLGHRLGDETDARGKDRCPDHRRPVSPRTEPLAPRPWAPTRGPRSSRRGAAPTSAGPRSPNSFSSSAEKVSSNETRRTPEVSVATVAGSPASSDDGWRRCSSPSPFGRRPGRGLSADE